MVRKFDGEECVWFVVVWWWGGGFKFILPQLYGSQSIGEMFRIFDAILRLSWVLHVEHVRWHMLSSNLTHRLFTNSWTKLRRDFFIYR